MRRMRSGAIFLTEPGDSSATKWQPERVTIYEDMNTHWTPGEYDRHTEQLKNALESLRKQDEQLKRTTGVSPKRKAQKKTERVKRSDKRG
jgi:hypothetical protein